MNRCQKHQAEIDGNHKIHSLFGAPMWNISFCEFMKNEFSFGKNLLNKKWKTISNRKRELSLVKTGCYSILHVRKWEEALGVQAHKHFLSGKVQNPLERNKNERKKICWIIYLNNKQEQTRLHCAMCTGTTTQTADILRSVQPNVIWKLYSLFY